MAESARTARRRSCRRPARAPAAAGRRTARAARAPGDGRPGGAVPQPRNEKYDEKTEVEPVAHPPLAGHHRLIDIFEEEGIEGDVPASPHLDWASAEKRIIEIDRQLDPEQPPGA